MTAPWIRTSLGDVARITTGSRNNQDKLLHGVYPFFVRSDKVERIDTYSFDGEAVLVPGEGRIGEIFHYVNGKFDVHQRVYKISDFSPSVSGRYIYYFMKHFFGDHAMTNTVKATVDSLRLPTFKTFELYLPSSVSEQEGVVEALDEADDLIATLESLIAKKQAIKQGMMQQLLTGRTRLPGFSERWTNSTIGELAGLRTGRPCKQSSSGQYWIVDMGSVTREGEFIVSKKTSLAGDLLEPGELVMPKDDIGGGLIIGRTGLIDKPNTYVLADHVFALSPDGVDPGFLNYAINSYDVNVSLRAKATGSAQLGLSKKSVVEQRIFHPPTTEEQRSIAETISDSEAEIGVLRQRLRKAHSIKTGMMQQLLTGRTRLPVEAAS